MSLDAFSLANDFGIYDPSVLTEDEKAKLTLFPTPKQFVDAISLTDGENLDFDELGDVYTKHYKDYAVDALGMSPLLAEARSLTIKKQLFNGMDTSTFNSTWEGVLNPQKQQAEVQQQQQLEKQQEVSLLDTATQGYSDMKAAEMLDLNRQYQEAILKLEQNVKDAGPMTRWLYDATLEDSKKGLQETQDWLAQYEADKKSRAVNPTLEKFQQAKTFGDTWDAFKEHPIDAITYGAASSAIPSTLMLGNAYLGNRVGGATGAMVAGGASSADMEYKSGVMEALSEAGVNVSDRQALDKALKNPELMSKIDLQAGQKAAVVGALDAASLGVAGAIFPSSPVKSTLANAFIAQPALGAGGEALGSVYSGQEIKPGAVALEALGEVPGALVETAMMRRGASPTPQRDAAIDTTTVIPQPIQPIQPNANPLSQFAQKPQTATQTNSPPEQPNGLDMNAVIDRMIGAESAGKADAKNPLSSAEGLGQFIDSTWLAMVKKHRPDIASGKSDDAILALKTNGALSREMTTRYAEDNLAELQASGFEATGRNVYLAHHFGVDGASNLLRADPNSPVSTVVSEKVIQQNPYMKGKSVGEVLNVISNKMGEQAGAVSANNSGSQSVRTSEGFQNTATEPSIQENSQTTSASTPEVKTSSSTPAIDSEPTPTATVSPTLTETNQAIDTARPAANTESVVVNPPPTLDEANRTQAVLDNQPSQVVPSTETSSAPATPNANLNTPEAPSRTVIPSVDIPEVNHSQAASLQGLPNTANTTEQSSTANPQNIAAPVTIPPADNTPIAQSELAPVSTVDIGKKGVISDENNQEQSVDFQVVDVADLSLPDDNSSKPKRKGAKRTVDSIIQKPVYARLNMQHSILDEGAPVLRSDNTIVAGNQRILGLKGAYAAGRASQYKKSLMADLKSQGVDTTAISQMKAPVLVRRVQGGVAGAQATPAPMATTDPLKVNASLDQAIHQVATDKQLSNLAEDALLSVFGESPKNQAIADRLLRQFFFDNFVQSETYPDSRSFVTARMNELRSSGALKLISYQYFSGNSVFKLKDDASRKPISAEKAEAAIRRILGNIPFETTIPDEIRSGAGDAADRVKGAFANGKIHIDTSNIGSVAEAEALAIEELVHRGVANLFGSDYDARLMELYEAVGGQAGIRRFIEQHKIEMADDYFNQPPQAQMDELLAHIEANQSTLTVRVKRAFQRLIAHLRNAIRKLNTKVLHNVSDSDIILIARNARNAAVNATSSPINNPRFGIRPEQESAAITEERMIAEEYSKRTRVPLADRVKRSLYSGKSTLQEQQNTLRRELFKTDSDWWAGVKQWTKRYFYANSTLGRDIADARRSIDQNNAAEHKLVEQDLVLLDALIHNIYGKPSSELTVDEQEQLHQALTGKEVFANSKHQAQLQYFRRRIDDLSQRLINEKYREMQMRIDELNDEGKAVLRTLADEWLDPNYQYEEGQPIPKALMQIHRLQMQINTIEGNKGAYLNRSYQAFTDPDWATKVRKKPVFKEAITFVMEQKAQQLKQDADSQITKAQASIRRIQARVSKQESLEDELSSVDKKRLFRITKLQQLQQVNTTGLNADELAAHQRRINTTTKELTDFNVESARLKQRINDITSGNFKLDKSETERIAKHQENINKLQLEKESVDQGKHPYLLTRDQAAVKLGDWLNGTAGQRSLLDFASGQGTNEGILKRRKDIPPVLRELLGEFTDPVYNYANTITQVADYVAKQQFQMSLRHFLKSMPNIAFIGSAPESIATKKFPETAAYDVLNDLLVEEQFMKDLEEFGVLPAIKDPYWLALTRLSTTVKLGKTAVAAPTTLARNFWSAGVSLVGAGHSPFSGASGAWKVIRNSRHRKDWLSGNILLSDKEAVELNQKYIRLGIRGDGASSNELARMFRDLQTAQDAAHAVKERSVGEKFVDWSLATYAFGDDFFKIICFEKDYADLVKAGLNPVEAEQEAARRTRDAMPTYSMIPRALQMLRRFPLAAPFVSFPWEQLRTTKNNLALIYGDYNRAKQTGNAHWKTMAYKRALGQLVANRGVWAIASFSAMVFGISGDDDDALDHFASDWLKGLLRVYFGADENGVASINFTPIVPSEYIWRAFRIGWQQGKEEGFGSGLYHTMEKLAEPFYQWDISFKGIMNLSMNRDDNGFPIYGEGKSLHDLIANPIDNADNWDKALGYFAKQLGPGIIQNINDFNRALSGSVADANAEDQNWIDNYWNERAASLGGKVSRSGKEFTLVDAVAALLGFRVTHQNMVVLGQQAGQQTKNKVAAYSSEFKDAIGVTNPLSPEFLDSRLELVLANRERAFGKMMDLVQYYRNQGKPNAQILKDLYVDEGVTLSKKELKFLIEGRVPPFEVSKEVMSKALSSVEHLSNPAERFRAKQALAERYRYVVKRAAEMQRID